MGRKHYSEEVKTMAMKAMLAGDKIKTLNEKTGISLRTLGMWKAEALNAEIPGVTGTSDVVEALNQQGHAGENAKKDVLELLAEGRLRYLEHAIAPETVKKESGYYATMAAGKLNEAHQLLTGGATQRIDGDFASWLTRQRAQSGTAPRLEQPKTEESVAKHN